MNIPETIASACGEPEYNMSTPDKKEHKHNWEKLGYYYKTFLVLIP